jgi:HSP20 family protein
MKLFKWSTKNIKPKFNNLIESFLGKNINDGKDVNQEVSTIPSVNISDENKAFEVEIAVPGIDKKDIKVEIDKNCLVISSEKQYTQEDKEKNWLRKEYGYASFQRMFQLPKNADENRIDATINNGILKVVVAKSNTATSSTKQIEIK